MSKINNVLGPIGFVITIAGFWFTLLQLHRTKTSAVAAEQAAKGALSKISKYNAITELTKAKAAADIVRRYQSLGFWLAVPDAYNALAAILEELEEFTVSLLTHEVTALNALYEFAREKEQFCADAIESQQIPNGSRFNRELSTHTRALGRILGRLKQELEGQDGTS